jgi:hypothetical protein
MRKETQKHLDNIMDCMAGADGGIRFVNLLMLLRGMDEKADEGDNDAQQVLDVMIRFSKMIDVANINRS